MHRTVAVASFLALGAWTGSASAQQHFWSFEDWTESCYDMPAAGCPDGHFSRNPTTFPAPELVVDTTGAECFSEKCVRTVYEDGSQRAAFVPFDGGWVPNDRLFYFETRLRFGPDAVDASGNLIPDAVTLLEVGDFGGWAVELKVLRNPAAAHFELLAVFDDGVEIAPCELESPLPIDEWFEIAVYVELNDTSAADGVCHLWGPGGEAYSNGVDWFGGRSPEAHRFGRVAAVLRSAGIPMGTTATVWIDDVCIADQDNDRDDFCPMERMDANPGVDAGPNADAGPPPDADAGPGRSVAGDPGEGFSFDGGGGCTCTVIEAERGLPWLTILLVAAIGLRRVQRRCTRPD